MTREEFQQYAGVLYDIDKLHPIPGELENYLRECVTSGDALSVPLPDSLKRMYEYAQEQTEARQKNERPDYKDVRKALRDTASQARDAVDIRLSQVGSLYNGVSPNRVRIADAAPFVDDILRMMYEDAQYERSTLSNIIHVMSDYDTEAESFKPDWLGCIPRPLLYCFCVNLCYRVDVTTNSNPDAGVELHQLGFCIALSNTFAIRVSFTVENNSVHIRQI